MKMKNHHGDRFENQMIVRKDNVKSKMLFFSFLLDEKKCSDDQGYFRFCRCGFNQFNWAETELVDSFIK